jgi:DnaJ homolog subfamily A member 2
MNPEDLFAQFFSGGMGFGPGMGMPGMGGMHRGPRRGEDSTIPYDVTLEDLYNGKMASFHLEKDVICGQCHGYVQSGFALRMDAN